MNLSNFHQCSKNYRLPHLASHYVDPRSLHHVKSTSKHDHCKRKNLFQEAPQTSTPAKDVSMFLLSPSSSIQSFVASNTKNLSDFRLIGHFHEYVLVLAFIQEIRFPPCYNLLLRFPIIPYRRPAPETNNCRKIAEKYNRTDSSDNRPKSQPNHNSPPNGRDLHPAPSTCLVQLSTYIEG